MYTTKVIIFFLVGIVGLGFYSLLPKSIPDLLRIIASPAVGFFVFGQIAILLAFVLGINILSISLSFFLFALISVYLFTRHRNPINFKLKNSPVFLFSTLIIISLSVYIFFNQVLAKKDFGLVSGGGGIYGDTALHSAYTSRLAEGEFPPQNPLYAGKILVYPLANDLLSAILRLGRLNLNLSFALPQVVFMIGFLVLFYSFCRKFMSDKGYLFSVLFLFFGWGIGWFFFFREWGESSVPFLDFIKTDFTNNETYNLHFHNILTGLIWPERSFLPGIFLALWSYLNFLSYEETFQKKYLILNGFILGTLPFWHTHTFIFLAASNVVFFIKYLMTNFSRKLTKEILLSVLVSVVLAMPFIWLFLINIEGESFLNFSLGWMNKNENLAVYWLKNGFLIIPFAIGGLFFLKKNYLHFFLPPILIFLLANFVIFQPWEWDNIKLLTLSFIFFSVAVGILFDFISRKNLIIFILLLLTIPAFTFSGFLSVLLQLKNTYTIYDNFDIDLANWAKANTGANEVFLINPIPNHPIPGLAGRLVYIGYPGHLWVHGINYLDRELKNKLALAGDLGIADQMEPKPSYIVTENLSSFFGQFEVIYENHKYKVLRVDLEDIY